MKLYEVCYDSAIFGRLNIPQSWDSQINLKAQAVVCAKAAGLRVPSSGQRRVGNFHLVTKLPYFSEDVWH